MKDYPAGHSVDTRWYAIDECGHVASFYTGESGAIPTRDTAQIGEYEEDENSSIMDDGRLSVRTVSADHVALLAKTFRGIHRDPKMSIGGMLYVLNGLSDELKPFLLAKEGRPSGGPIIRPVGKLFLLATHWPGFEKEGLHRKIHDLGLCVACTSSFNTRGARVGNKGDFIFSYDHPSANCDAWPYFLQYVPENAKVLGKLSLSRGEKEALEGGIVIPGCFRNRIFLQPADEVECSFYDEETKPVSVSSKKFKGILEGPFGYW